MNGRGSSLGPCEFLLLQPAPLPSQWPVHKSPGTIDSGRELRARGSESRKGAARSGEETSPRRQRPPTLSAREHRGLPGSADSFPAASSASGGRMPAQDSASPHPPRSSSSSWRAHARGLPGNLHARLRFPGARSRGPLLPARAQPGGAAPRAAQAQWGVPPPPRSPSPAPGVASRRRPGSAALGRPPEAAPAKEPAAQGRLSPRRQPSPGGVRPRAGGAGTGSAVGVAWAAGSRGRAERGQPRPPTASRRADRLGWPRLWASSRGVGASAAAPAPGGGARRGEGCKAAAGTAAAGCECGPSPRGAGGPRGPSLAAARPCSRPGGSLDLGPPDASRRSSPCAPLGALVSPVPEAGDGNKM